MIIQIMWFECSLINCFAKVVLDVGVCLSLCRLGYSLVCTVSRAMRFMFNLWFYQDYIVYVTTLYVFSCEKYCSGCKLYNFVINQDLFGCNMCRLSLLSGVFSHNSLPVLLTVCYREFFDCWYFCFFPSKNLLSRLIVCLNS
ncbi:hypothetical protein Hanom_Chr11g00974451 [Helianthus anomalus]